ncbi:MAG TPA: SDR family oxidoreductase [Kofleriaceae bacterium]|nr:SDR family oxidoreductase [Kofleriaceae bacterium]
MPLPDLTGKNAIVTGANTGIGRITALELARAGARVWLACRSKDKTQPVIDEIKAAGGEAEFLALDLGSLATVRAGAQAFLELGLPLHILVNNAGHASARGTTRDGFEMTFAVNHLGPFLFTVLLLPRLKEAAPARIVNVASKAHYRAKPIDFARLQSPTRSITGLEEYGVSKLGNVLFSRELAKRLEGTGVTTYALHPGVIASDIWRRIPWPVRPVALKFMKTTEEGAQTSIWCATAPELAAATGRYYDDRKEKRPSKVALDDALAAQLWAKSAEWAGVPATV